MTDHNIKINRARDMTKWGNNPETFGAALGYITPQTLDKINAIDLAEMIDNIVECMQTSRSLEAKEILENGFVWDTKNNLSQYMPDQRNSAAISAFFYWARDVV